MEEHLKAAKTSRRTAKSSLTRVGNALNTLIERKRSAEEVRETLVKLKQAFENLVLKHEEFSQMIEDDEEYDKEEVWISECQQAFMQLDIEAKTYLESLNKSQQQELSEENLLPTLTENAGTLSDHSSSGMIGMQPGMGAAETVSKADNNKGQAVIENNAVIFQDNSKNSDSNQHEKQDEKGESTTSTLNFRLEKPKLPSFSGDVREYAIFRADFKHVVEANHSKRDSIMLLRTCLKDKPLDLIKGIGSDYDAAWEYLDSIYGDPRFVSDTVTNDIIRFKTLQDGDDARFCDLVHLVNRCYNTLKEVGLPSDMDNSHMLSVIEQKMCADDRKVWSRDLERERKKPTLQALMAWMTTEMKSRMRATAPLRSTHQNTGRQQQNVRQSVHHVASGETKSKATTWHKCWVCKTSEHWVDQCHVFKAKSPSERLKAVKENRACFSCLKRAGRDHKSQNCSRRRQCTETTNGSQCSQYHHQLIHTNSVSENVASLRDIDNVLLPIVSGNICGENGFYQRGNIMFDSGAQLSLIHQQTADSLGLKGKAVSITMTKVGGEEEVIKTHLYKVPITSLTNNNKYIIKAIGIPRITNDIDGVRLKSITEHLKLEGQQITRGKGTVHLLIGVDHARMHTGEMKQSGNLAARNSPLGWVVFGSLSDNVENTGAKSVLHVKYAPPVDLTSFWTTEAMGVNVKHRVADHLSTEEQAEAAIIEESCKKVDKQWLIPYPWIKDPNQLPDNNR